MLPKKTNVFYNQRSKYKDDLKLYIIFPRRRLKMQNSNLEYAEVVNWNFRKCVSLKRRNKAHPMSLFSMLNLCIAAALLIVLIKKNISNKIFKLKITILLVAIFLMTIVFLLFTFSGIDHTISI